MDENLKANSNMRFLSVAESCAVALCSHACRTLSSYAPAPSENLLHTFPVVLIVKNLGFPLDGIITGSDHTEFSTMILSTIADCPVGTCNVFSVGIIGYCIGIAVKNSKNVGKIVAALPFVPFTACPPRKKLCKTPS
jgi:hypothetical protein